MGDMIHVSRGIYEMLFLFFFWAFIGWIVEVIDMRIEAGEFQNRGFLHMPICPLYGIVVPMLNMFLGGRRQSYFMLFIGGIVLCTVFEYLVGWMLESFFSARWWDYSHMRFNYKGRICLRNSILFGVGTLLGIGFVHPEVEMLVHRIPEKAGQIIFVIAVFLLTIDVVTSVRRALYYRQTHDDNETYVIFKSHR